MAALIQLCGGRVAEELPPEQLEQYKTDFTGTLGKIIRLKPCGPVLPEAFKYFDEDIYNFTFRPDDVLVMTYPKCGTTWTQEIVWTMRNNPNLDHPNPQESLYARSPFLEQGLLLHNVTRQVPFEKFIGGHSLSTFKTRCPTLHPNRPLSIQVAESYTEPRTLKTHLPFSCFKPGLIDSCKVVFVMRHPKDTMLSYHHQCRIFNGEGHRFRSTLDVFVKYFVEDLVIWGSYGNITKEALQLKSHPNLHIMHYEDMKADIGAELRRLNRFLATDLTEQQLKNVQEQTSFSAMQKSDPLKMLSNFSLCDAEVAKKEGGFMHKGQAGAWKGKLTQEQNALMDKYIAENFDDPELKARYQ